MKFTNILNPILTSITIVLCGFIILQNHFDYIHISESGWTELPGQEKMCLMSGDEAILLDAFDPVLKNAAMYLKSHYNECIFKNNYLQCGIYIFEFTFEKDFITLENPAPITLNKDERRYFRALIYDCLEMREINWKNNQ